MSKASAETEFILSYVEKYLDDLNDKESPLGKKTLARIIVRENPDQYTEKDIEQIRSVIRRYCGADNGVPVVPRFNVQNADKGKAQKRANQEDPRTPYRQARVLVFDIETSPIIAYTWGIWNQNIPTDNIIKDWMILTWAAKWLFEDKVYSAKIRPSEIKRDDDSRVVKALWSIIDEADIVIAHNAKKFDVKRMNTRFLKHGLNLPSPYLVIDTLLHARKKFNITSNRLDYIARDFLGIKGKMETPNGLWRQCIEGSKDAITVMDEYCQQDVKVLEDVYFHLRPYIQPHPNIGLLESSDKPQCPSCGSNDLKPIGNYNTYVNTFMAFRCGCCGSVSRSRVNSTTKQTRDNLNVSTPQ